MVTGRSRYTIAYNLMMSDYVSRHLEVGQTSLEQTIKHLISPHSWLDSDLFASGTQCVISFKKKTLSVSFFWLWTERKLHKSICQCSNNITNNTWTDQESCSSRRRTSSRATYLLFGNQMRGTQSSEQLLRYVWQSPLLFKKSDRCMK